MKLAIAAAVALSLAACAQGPKIAKSYPAERAATLARGAHNSVCRAAISAHTAGALVGAQFNRAKALCEQVDTVLDAADAALIMGDDATALAKVNAANAALAEVRTLTTEPAR